MSKLQFIIIFSNEVISYFSSFLLFFIILFHQYFLFHFLFHLENIIKSLGTSEKLEIVCFIIQYAHLQQAQGSSSTYIASKLTIIQFENYWHFYFQI